MLAENFKIPLTYNAWPMNKVPLYQFSRKLPNIVAETALQPELSSKVPFGQVKLKERPCFANYILIAQSSSAYLLMLINTYTKLQNTISRSMGKPLFRSSTSPSANLCSNLFISATESALVMFRLLWRDVNYLWLKSTSLNTCRSVITATVYNMFNLFGSFSIKIIIIIQ